MTINEQVSVFIAVHVPEVQRGEIRVLRNVQPRAKLHRQNRRSELRHLYPRTISRSPNQTFDKRPQRLFSD